MLTGLNVSIGGPQRLLADGLRRIIEQYQGRVVNCSGDLRGLVGTASVKTVDITVVDCGEGPWEASQIVSSFRGSCPNAKLLLLADTSSAAAQTSGTCRVLSKTAAPNDFAEALVNLAWGSRAHKANAFPQNSNRIYLRNGLVLTRRQADILSLICRGESVKQIGGSLCISPRTVEFHKYRLMRALRVASNLELIRFALDQGLADYVQPEPRSVAPRRESGERDVLVRRAGM